MQYTKSKRVLNYNRTKKTTGGDINKNNIFSHIKSIGFEIETTDLIKFTLESLESHNRSSKRSPTRSSKPKEILVNSALTNIDLEYGYMDENEYTDIIDTPELKFKITNDSAEDSEFNKHILEIFEPHMNDDGDCKKPVFKLEIPKNKYLKQTTYDIKIREPDLELHNCSSFTDVEWIVTYYKPKTSPNVILNTFYNSMGLLKDHLSKLIPIEDSKFYYLKGRRYVPFEHTKINQTYVLPDTSLIYYNNSTYDIPHYNINEHLKIVVQMTFSCDILYVFRIMKALLSIEYTSKQLEILKKQLETSNHAMNNINKMIEQTTDNENFDLDAINNSLKLVNRLFAIYNNKEYVFPSDNETKKIKLYLFLIMYKLYIYLNSYLQNKQEKSESLFKKSLSFAVRHNNYSLYLEIKKIIRRVFSSKFEGKDETYINEEIVQIINNIVRPIDKEKEVFILMYNFKDTRNIKRKLYELFKTKSAEIEQHFGNPLYSISSYFQHFETSSPEDEMEQRDWLVSNNIDEKSTKFELRDDTIIIEFRDFPSYSYLHLLIHGDDDIREEILQNNVGTLTMKTVNRFTIDTP